MNPLSRKPARLITCAAAAGMAALAIAACGGSSSAGTSTSSTKASSAAPKISAVASLEAMLPSSVKKSGVLTVGLSPNFAPYEYVASGGAIVGSEVDLARATAAKLGLKAQFIQSNFAGLLTGLAAGRFDVILSGMNDTPSREGQVTFVNYTNLANNILMSSTNAENYKNTLSLCGMVAGETLGTTFPGNVKSFSKACVAAHKPPIKLQLFDTSNDVVTALAANRVGFEYQVTGSNDYEAKLSNGELATVGEPQESLPTGYVITKTDTKLVSAIYAAVNNLMSTGELNTVMSKWGQEKEMFSKATIN